MRIAIATDCWHPQVDGITRTLDATARELRILGHDVLMLTPQDFAQLKLPYGDALILAHYPKVSRILREFCPDTVHIATQGLLGIATRTWCAFNQAHFTTAFHTRFPEYGKLRHRLPENILYRYARLFHGSTAPVMVPSQSLAEVLRAKSIGLPCIWSRGVDTDLFRPRPKTWTHLPRPIFLQVGRIAAEKNIEAFLQVRMEGTKLIVGGGPLLEKLRANNPQAVFLGELSGRNSLAAIEKQMPLYFRACSIRSGWLSWRR